jgi:anti-sigma regulatory factor (Ser/Thr protein kinase)
VRDGGRVLRLERRRGSVATARHWARDLASGRGLDGDGVSTVELLTSELVANAIRHGSSPVITVRAIVRRAELVLAVTDGDDALPVVRTTGPEVPGGHGMRLVERLASRWGVRHEPGNGKTVWFAVPR